MSPLHLLRARKRTYQGRSNPPPRRGAAAAHHIGRHAMAVPESCVSLFSRASTRRRLLARHCLVLTAVECLTGFHHHNPNKKAPLDLANVSLSSATPHPQLLPMALRRRRWHGLASRPLLDLHLNNTPRCRAVTLSAYDDIVCILPASPSHLPVTLQHL